MLDNKLLQLIDETGVVLELASAVVEKDYYVTQIIHALSGIENEYFRLVFAGGTCLAKAHKIVKRMSEDVDFKIQFKSVGKTFSKNESLKELKRFRSLITSKLTLPGLTVDPPIFSIVFSCQGSAIQEILPHNIKITVAPRAVE